MKVLLTTAITLSVFSMLEQNVQALDFKGPTFQLARGGGGDRGGRGEGGRRMESHPTENLGNSHAGNLNDHSNEGHLEQNTEINHNRNWNGDAGWEGTGGWGDEGGNLTGCVTGTNGDLICP